MLHRAAATGGAGRVAVGADRGFAAGASSAGRGQGGGNPARCPPPAGTGEPRLRRVRWMLADEMASQVAVAATASRTARRCEGMGELHPAARHPWSSPGCYGLRPLPRCVTPAGRSRGCPGVPTSTMPPISSRYKLPCPLSCRGILRLWESHPVAPMCCIPIRTWLSQGMLQPRASLHPYCHSPAPCTLHSLEGWEMKPAA